MLKKIKQWLLEQVESMTPDEVKVGQIWRYESDDSPWPPSYSHDVEVLDVKDGWVRYKWIGSTLWTNERHRIGMFRHLHDKVS